MSPVVTPGTTIARNSASTVPTSWLTRRSFSSSVRERHTIMTRSDSPSRHRFLDRLVDHRVELAGDDLGSLRTVHGPERRPAAVILQHRSRARLIHLQPFEHDVLVV